MAEDETAIDRVDALGAEISGEVGGVLTFAKPVHVMAWDEDANFAHLCYCIGYRTCETEYPYVCILKDGTVSLYGHARKNVGIRIPNAVGGA